MCSPRRSSGAGGAFTVAEMLVVTVIMGLAAGMVLPFVTGTSDMQAMSAARMLASDLQYAQNVAITSQETVTVTIDPANETYQVANASGVLIHPMNRTAFIVQFKALTGFDEVDIVSASFGGAALVSFDELGAPNNAGTVAVQAGSNTYTVTVAAATGKVTVTGP